MQFWRQHGGNDCILYMTTRHYCKIRTKLKILKTFCLLKKKSRMYSSTSKFFNMVASNKWPFPGPFKTFQKVKKESSVFIASLEQRFLRFKLLISSRRIFTSWKLSKLSKKCPRYAHLFHPKVLKWKIPPKH